jgi:hypothetical protein
MKKIAYTIIGLILAIVIFAAIYLSRTVNTVSITIEGFTPIRDSSLVKKFTPVFISNSEFGLPREILYRASVDEQGNTFIAYHPVWDYERNSTPGLVPFLSRILYTGGLHIQQIMFGEADIEVVGIKLDRQKRIVEIHYERPKNYDPQDFVVAHEPVVLTGTFQTPLMFRVVSWNHLFDFIPTGKRSEDEKAHALQLEPEYFTRELWEKYTMVKVHETRLRKCRAHFPWEREHIE